MESILMGSILFWGAFFGEHFMGSIWRGAFVRRASDPESANHVNQEWRFNDADTVGMYIV